MRLRAGSSGDLARARAGAPRSVGLRRVRARHPRDLSSGRARALVLASVLVIEPGSCVVLDEPTRGVDPESAELAALLRLKPSHVATR